MEMKKVSIKKINEMRREQDIEKYRKFWEELLKRKSIELKGKTK